MRLASKANNQFFKSPLITKYTFISSKYCIAILPVISGENLFLDISEVNRHYHISHSLGHILHSLDISQYIGCTREAQDFTTNILIYIPTPTHAEKKKELSVKVATTTNSTFFCITLHFYFLLRLFSSNLKIIISHNSTINLCTTCMAVGSFAKYIAGISDPAALTRHSLGSWFEKVF